MSKRMRRRYRRRMERVRWADEADLFVWPDPWIVGLRFQQMFVYDRMDDYEHMRRYVEWMGAAYRDMLDYQFRHGDMTHDVRLDDRFPEAPFKWVTGDDESVVDFVNKAIADDSELQDKIKESMRGHMNLLVYGTTTPGDGGLTTRHDP